MTVLSKMKEIAILQSMGYRRRAVSPASGGPMVRLTCAQLSTASLAPTGSRVFEHPNGLEVRSVVVASVGLGKQPRRRLGPASQIRRDQQAPHRPVRARSTGQLAVSTTGSLQLRPLRRSVRESLQRLPQRVQ